MNERSRGRSRTAAAPPPKVESRPRPVKAIWDAMTLLPNPVPEINYEQIETQTRFLGYDCSLPLILQLPRASAEHHDSLRQLAAAAAGAQVPFVCGELNRVLRDPDHATGIRAALDGAHEVPALFELNASTMAQEEITDEAVRGALIAVGASGVIIRLDFDELAVASLASPEASGLLAAISWLVENLEIPVLVRVAAGLPRSTARALLDYGVRGLLVGGSEVFEPLSAQPGQAAQSSSNRSTAGASTFAGWGIPTVAAVRMLRSIGVPVVSDGGIETGLDTAKAIALGADLVASGPGRDAAAQDLSAWLDRFSRELRTTMFLTGARRLGNLKQIPFVATGDTREWLEAAESSWRGDPRGD